MWSANRRLFDGAVGIDLITKDLAGVEIQSRFQADDVLAEWEIVSFGFVLGR